MNVSATYHGESVNIVAIIPVGSLVYVAYIDDSDNLKLAKDFFASNIDTMTLAISATPA